MQTALATAAQPAVLAAQTADAGVRPMPAANFHLTLAFLGSVPVDRLSAVQDAAVRGAQASGLDDQAIEIVLDGLDHWRQPQVLVATASETPPAAVVLAESLKRSLIDADLSPDLKPFRVHATVARKVRRMSVEPHIEPVRWRFTDFALVHSQAGPAGSVYEVVKRYAW
jgi:RNA 2',3'-cyclic 3'-phosphodiesterase